MNFRGAIKHLNFALHKYQPETFSSSWVLVHARPVYNYIRINHRTENNDVDWDRITYSIDRSFQKRWVRYRRKRVKFYENQKEVNRILLRYKDKLYTLIAPASMRDKNTRNRIIVALVRIAQKGNTCAREELVKWIMFVVDEWIDRHWQIYRWKGRTEAMEEKIIGCIRGYKYTGSFLGYLFRSLEYSARGIVSLQKYSLDDPVFDGDESKINYVIHDQQIV